MRGEVGTTPSDIINCDPHPGVQPPARTTHTSLAASTRMQPWPKTTTPTAAVHSNSCPTPGRQAGSANKAGNTRRLADA